MSNRIKSKIALADKNSKRFPFGSNLSAKHSRRAKMWVMTAIKWQLKLLVKTPLIATEDI